jgi:hypothetical protein
MVVWRQPFEVWRSSRSEGCVCVKNLAKCSNSGLQEVVMHVCFVIDLAVASGFLKMQLLVLSREQRKCECINFDV